MICSKCGLEVDAGATFCGNCGQPVQQGAAQPVAAQTAPVVAAAAPVATSTAAPSAIAPSPALNPAPVAPTGAAPTPLQAAPMPGPAYGTPAAYNRPGSGKAIAAFVLGIIGLIAWLIPILGLALGVMALIFGTMTTKSGHRNLAITGIVLGSISILLALGAFVYNVQAAAKQQAANGTVYSSSVVSFSWASHEIMTALVTPRNK
jgi:MFS family permease